MKTNFDNLDIILAISGIITSFFSIFIFYGKSSGSIYLILFVVVAISCIAWLVIRSYKIPEELNFFQNFRVYKLLFILYLILITLLIGSYYFRTEIYERPLVFFILASLLIGVLALEIVYAPNNNRVISILLLKIIILGVLLGLSQIALYPYLVGGGDPWVHQEITLKIVDEGVIPTGFSYSELPIMHINVAIASLFSDLNYKESVFLSMSLLQIVISTLCVFLIGKHLFNYKIGLLSSLIIVFSNIQLQMNTGMGPNGIAIVYILLIFYLIFKVKKYSFWDLLLIMIFMGTLILTHTLSSVCLLIILFILVLGKLFYDKIYREFNENYYPLLLLFFFGAFMVAWWTYSSDTITILTKLFESGFSDELFMVSPVSSIPFLIPTFAEKIFAFFGIFISFGISIIGSLFMISKKYGTINTFVFCLAGSVLLSIGFVPLFLNFTLLEERWWYFSLFFLSIPLALSIFLLFIGKSENSFKVLLLFLFFITFGFFMIISPMANMDNLMFSANSQYRHAPIASEYSCFMLSASKWEHNIGTDRYFSTLTSSIGYDTFDISDGLFTGSFSRYDGSMIVIRKEIINKPFNLYKGLFKLSYNPMQSLEKDGFSKIVDCKTMSSFIKE